MNARTSLRSLLGIEHAIIQAPMAGATTPELASAVSNAGGLGMLGAANSSPQQISDDIAATRQLTDRPFGVNLFAGGREPFADADTGPVMKILLKHHKELGLPDPSLPDQIADPFESQIEAVLASDVPVFSFTFGIPSASALTALRALGITVIGTATTVAEAMALEAAGVDAVVAQGSEAGAHRGTFLESFEASMIGTLALVPQVADAVSVPVIASGGIMDGRGIVAAEALGAAGVQMGTAFLTTIEAGIPAVHKAAILAARDDQTTLTRAFSGRPARGIINAFIEEFQGQEEIILPFPLQNAATRPLRNAARDQGDARFLSLWAGQAAGLARTLPAGDLVRQLVREAAEIRGWLNATHGT